MNQPTMLPATSSAASSTAIGQNASAAGCVLGVAALAHAAGHFGGAYPTNVMLQAGIAIIAAVSLNIVNGFTGQFSIGHAAFMAIGGYVSGMITYFTALSLGDPTQIDASILGAYQWLLLLSAIVGGAVAAAAGWLVGLPSLRLRGDYLAIVTLGFGEIVRIVLLQTRDQPISTQQLHESVATTGWLATIFHVGGGTGFTNLPKVTNLFWTYLLAAITVLLAIRLKRSSYGRALLSIREDEIAAEAMGVNVTKLKVRAFMLAAFFAGVAGTLAAHQPGNLLEPNSAGFQRSFDVVMMVVLGGLGSISGATLAAILVTILNAFLVPYGPYRMILFALILILMMIFRPQGLFGLREVWDFFRSRRQAIK